MQRDTAIGAQAEQDARSKALWERASSEGLRKWIPGMDVNRDGVRLLVGIAPAYSLLDIELVDQILATRPFLSGVEVELFDVSDVRAMKDIQTYIPGIVRFFHTPVAGVWLRGSLLKQAEGFAARELIRKVIAEGADGLI